MTVNKAIKKLQELAANGYGRAQFCVDKHSLDDRCGDIAICAVTEISGEYITMSDDDGGTKMNKDGSESMRSTVVLYGPVKPAVPDSTRTDHFFHNTVTITERPL